MVRHVVALSASATLLSAIPLMNNMKICGRNNLLPLLWWLSPWASACELNRIARAALEWGDLADLQLAIDERVIKEQSEEIRRLRQRVADLYDDIIRGKACNPDAYPVEERVGPGNQKASTVLPEGLSG